MTVHDIEMRMPASELAEWMAHFQLSNHEREQALTKARQRRGR